MFNLEKVLKQVIQSFTCYWSIKPLSVVFGYAAILNSDIPILILNVSQVCTFSKILYIHIIQLSHSCFLRWQLIENRKKERKSIFNACILNCAFGLRYWVMGVLCFFFFLCNTTIHCAVFNGFYQTWMCQRANDNFCSCIFLQRNCLMKNGTSCDYSSQKRTWLYMSTTWRSKLYHCSPLLAFLLMERHKWENMSIRKQQFL